MYKCQYSLRYNTCIDRDGDGYIRTSQGLADILSWGDSFGTDSAGGVSTADDEAITEYTRVSCTGTRTIAVDKFNDIWVGGNGDLARTHLKVNGLTGSVVPNSAFAPGCGGYGGVIDGLGNLWSSGGDNDQVLWLIPPTNLPPVGADWQNLTGQYQVRSGYGIAVDPVYPRLWQTSGSDVFYWNTNGTPMTNSDGSARLFYSGDGGPKGLAVDANGHVWVAHAETSYTVGHLNTNGTWLGDVSLRVTGLFAEYFDRANPSRFPVLSGTETNPVAFSWADGWPAAPVPTNNFTAQWSGIISPQVQGDHVFYVSVEAGARFSLTVNGTTITDKGAIVLDETVKLTGNATLRARQIWRWGRSLTTARWR